MLNDNDIRTLVADLQNATEEPHHHLVSFRINNRIFATMPADASYLNIFAPESDREQMLAMHPDAFEKVWWGKKVMGIRALTDRVDKRDVAALLRSAYQAKL